MSVGGSHPLSWGGVVASVLLAVVVFAACSDPNPLTDNRLDSLPEWAAEAEFVGGSACAGCHEAEAASWAGSHHDRAMMAPTRDAVLAPFDGERLEHFGEVFVFRSEEDRFIVETAGPDGWPAEFDVAYTFGIEALEHARTLLALDPRDPSAQALVAALGGLP